MANYPPPVPPPGSPPGSDPRFQRRVLRDQARVQQDMIRAQRDMYRAQVRGLRRGSLVGPLLVVVLGIVFLLVQMGRLPAGMLWSLYGRWWPFLLIGIGVIRLAEWGFDEASQRGLSPMAPRPRRVLGGGVISLLILLGGSGLLLSAVHSHGRELFEHGFSLNQDNLDEFLGDKHESEQTVSHSCPEGTTVSVENSRGNIFVTGTSDDGQLHISTHKEVYTRTDSEASTRAQQLAPRVDSSGSNLVISVPAIEGGRADLTITVPAATTLSLNANRGDVRISSVKAAVSVTANHGDIDLSAVHGAILAHINHGDSSFAAHSVTGPVSIEGRGKDLTLSDMSGPVSMSGEFFGTTHLEHVRGPVRFHTSRTDLRLERLDGNVDISPNADLSMDQVAGPVTLNTRDRNLTLERVSGDVAVTNRNGSVDLTFAPPLGTTNVENRNGSVNVTMPNEAGFVLRAETTNGEIQNEFSLPRAGGENRPAVSGTVKGGGPLVRITTSQGDISLKKTDIAPLPPAPPDPPALTLAPVSREVRDGTRTVAERARLAAREAAEQLKIAQEQVRSANREASEAERETRSKAVEAKAKADRAAREAKQAAEKE